MGKKVSIFENGLVPEHVLLSEEEKQELLERYNIKLANLPRIFDTDPAVKELGAKLKDVIKIIRKSELGEEIYYRVVVRSK